MTTLVYINGEHGLVKSSFEAVTYAKKLGGDVVVVSSGKSADLGKLGEYGANKVLVDSSLEKIENELKEIGFSLFSIEEARPTLEDVFVSRAMKAEAR